MINNSLKLEKISFICKVIQNILDNILPPHIYKKGTKISFLRKVICDEFSKNNILTLKNFVIDGYLVDDFCHISQFNQVVHGNGYCDEILEGILKIDLVGFKDGVYGDAARSYVIGYNKQHINLVNTSKQAFFSVLDHVKTGDYFYKISKLIHDEIKKNNFFVSPLLGGHGIGEKLHEHPFVSNYYDENVKNQANFLIQEGLILAVEPVVFSLNNKIWISEDMKEKSSKIHVPIITDENNYVAHYENTIYFDSIGPKLISEF